MQTQLLGIFTWIFELDRSFSVCLPKARTEIDITTYGFKIMHFGPSITDFTHKPVPHEELQSVCDVWELHWLCSWGKQIATVLEARSDLATANMWQHQLECDPRARTLHRGCASMPGSQIPAESAEPVKFCYEGNAKLIFSGLILYRLFLWQAVSNVSSLKQLGKNQQPRSSE